MWDCRATHDTGEIKNTTYSTKRAYYRNVKLTPQGPAKMGKQEVSSIMIKEDLFSIILKYAQQSKILTSYYNHGHGVRREYTYRWHLQETYSSENTASRFYIKRGGASPSRLHRYAKDMERIITETPTFEIMHRNIERKYSEKIIRTYTQTSVSDEELLKLLSGE